jgi:hypothetical protein
MKETRLATNLGKCLGGVALLANWNEETSSGCLGNEVAKVLEHVGGYLTNVL